MKTIKPFLTLIFFLTLFIANSQSQEQTDYEKNKVEIFSDEERANMQWYFYKKTKELGLSEEVEEKYYRILTHYVFDMHRLDDKDKGFTKDEMKTKLEELVIKMNSKIKTVLTEEQYKMHENNFNDILQSVYRKNGWKWVKE